MTDYGAVKLKPVGLDEHGNPKFERDNETADVVVLKLVSQSKGHARHAVNVTSSLLCALAHHRLITRPEYDSGLRLKEDWHRAGLSPNLGADLMGLSRGECQGRSEAQEKAYQSWKAAVVSLGPLGWPVCDLVLYDKEPKCVSTFFKGIRRLQQFYEKKG